MYCYFPRLLGVSVSSYRLSYGDRIDRSAVCCLSLGPVGMWLIGPLNFTPFLGFTYGFQVTREITSEQLWSLALLKVNRKLRVMWGWWQVLSCKPRCAICCRLYTRKRESLNWILWPGKNRFFLEAIQLPLIDFFFSTQKNSLFFWRFFPQDIDKYY